MEWPLELVNLRRMLILLHADSLVYLQMIDLKMMGAKWYDNLLALHRDLQYFSVLKILLCTLATFLCNLFFCISFIDFFVIVFEDRLSNYCYYYYY